MTATPPLPPPPPHPPASASASEGDATTPSEKPPADSSMLPVQKPRLLIQKTHAAFVSKLYAMVSDQSTDALIAWSGEGDSFKVTDPVTFARKVLPVYFKHGNWQSFVRQLNMYGFHKISDLAYGGIFGDAQLWMFKHHHFRRGELKLLQNIRRRGPKALVQASASTLNPLSSPASGQQDAAPATPTLSSSSTQPPPLPVTASASPSPNEATAASSPGFCMDDYVANLKRSIADLQQFNTQLHRENQAMHAKITQVQGAFAGIMGFLETAIVQPAARHTHGAETVPPVVDAFRKLASDIAPALSCCGDRQGCNASTSSLLPPAPSRSGRFQSQLPDAYHGHSHSHGYNCSQPCHLHSAPGHRHSCSCSTTTLPPIRPSCCAQSGSFARVSGLTPPPQESCPLATEMFSLSRARRSSSSSSSGSSTILDGGNGEQKDLAPAQVDWARQPYSSRLESSLRETLPAKRPRIQ
ncbi:Flocculation suppression protein [Coemansia erecta]|nr:Flocculation suppression protein [Coemansia erecta]